MSRILVVEDDDSIRDNLKRFLKLEGYEVIEAANGREGMLKACWDSPDLILCDVMMPELDGFEMMNKLRANPDWTEVPVIFLTASAESCVRNIALMLGVDDQLTKPFNLADVLSLIRYRLGES